MPGGPLGGPSTGGPFGGPPGWTSPETPGGRGAAPAVDPADWRVWWSFHRDRYLDLGRALEGLDATTGGERGLGRDAVERQVVPAFERVLRQGGEDALVRASLLGLARLERQHGALGLGLDHYVRHHLRAGTPETREAALVALGVRGDAASVPTLRAVLLDDEAGRKALGDRAAGVRERAFAAYALGLLGSAAAEEDVRLSVADALLVALGADHSTTRETQVASALAVGLVALPFCGDDAERLARHEAEGDQHLCGGVQLDYLLEAFGDAELDPWLRAHVAPALGRLAAGAPDDWRAAVGAALVGALEAREPEPEVAPAAALGLGLLADGDGDALDRDLRERLAKVASKADDPLARRFALVAYARASARADADETDALEDALDELGRRLARRDVAERPWAALALAVLGRDRGDAAGAVPDDAARALRRRLDRAKEPGEAMALALGLGVLRDREAAELLVERFEEAEDPLERAHAALALGLLGARDAREPLREALESEDPGSPLALELAVALRLLGDREAGAALAGAMRTADEAEDRAAAAATLGLVGDGRAVGPLAEVLADAEAEAAVRAAAASALARVATGDRTSWSTPFACDLQYGLLTWTLRSPFGDGTGLLDMP